MDEEVHFVAGQSFLDAFRESIFNAVLGHRATMICTSRRVVVVRPSSLRASMQIAWIDATGMAAIERRRNLFRMVVGVVLLFYAISSLAGGMLSGFAAGLAGGSGIDGSILSMASSAGLIIASVAGLLGLLAILTASRRAMVVSCSGSEVLFCCMAMGPWHLAQIDAARQSLSSDAPSSKGRIAPPTTFEGG
ncbi:MAG: hypothetical protein CMJ34_05555 [Phycisphaerae bacterium]|nr:hypothetical protein [Phycisphaerae bacterium]